MTRWSRLDPADRVKFIWLTVGTAVGVGAFYAIEDATKLVPQAGLRFLIHTLVGAGLVCLVTLVGAVSGYNIAREELGYRPKFPPLLRRSPPREPISDLGQHR